jgi:thioredoxin 1
MSTGWKPPNSRGGVQSQRNMNSLFLSLLLGSALGAALGYFGKCSSGTCPLTANWWRGALYGAVVGLVFHVAYPHAGSTTTTSTHHVQLVGEPQFHAELRQATGPIVVDFFASWCGPCKRLSPMLESLAGPLTNRVKFLKIDVDQSTKLAGQFGVEAVPTLVFFEHGKIVDKMVGLPDRETLKLKLESLAGSGK